jgi:hypothetical protein
VWNSLPASLSVTSSENGHEKAPGVHPSGRDVPSETPPSRATPSTGPARARHGRGIRHAAAVRHVLVHLHRGDHRRRSVDHPGRVRAAVVAQTVYRPDVERVRALGASLRVARIEREHVDVPVGAGGRDHRRAGQELRRGHAAAVDDGDGNADGRCAAVGQAARVRRGIGGDGDRRRQAVEVHELWGAGRLTSRGARRADRELQRSGSIRGNRRPRQAERERVSAPGCPGVGAGTAVVGDPQADARGVHSRTTGDGGGNGQRRTRGVKEGASVRTGVRSRRRDDHARDLWRIGGHADPLRQVAGRAGRAVRVLGARSQVGGAASGERGAEQKDGCGAHGVRTRR